eukprot:m.232846 g.232846  ORF g.232846 m.232846 type:complete len:157 (-) comp18886_c0_seq1:34-504(-)
MAANSSHIELGEITQHNVRQLKLINSIVFPVNYTDKFYNDLVQAGELAKLAFFDDIPVGGVCCRVESEKGTKQLYIMTLGCLAPYRHLGIGTVLLNHAIAQARKDPSISTIALHVQVNNEVAHNFYKKFGFKVTDTVKDYYKRIEPADANVLTLTL